MESGLIVLAAAGAVVLLVGVPAITRRVLAARLEPRIAAAIPPERIVPTDLGAVSFGLRSRDVAQGRDNGALVLTPDELWFSRAVPRRDLRIALDTVTEVTTVRSHLGKTYFRDLLKVSFRAGGTDDAIVWSVSDPAAWQAKLADLSRAADPAAR